jgi:8-oxo-dGTP pyrophosphatase MutT (NUDIX family)
MSPHRLTKFRVAIYGVLIEDGRVLLTDTRVPSGIITNFPGGGLELGESPVEAVVREFKEETNLQVAVTGLLFCSQRFHQNPEYPHEQLMHIYYRVQRLSEDLQSAGNNDDVAQVSWISRAQLPSKRILDVDLEFIDHPSFASLF